MDSVQKYRNHKGVEQTPPNPAPEPRPEASLEDLDQLIKEHDPEFSSFVEEVHKDKTIVGAEAPDLGVAVDLGEESETPEEKPPEELKFFPRIKQQLQAFLCAQWFRIKGRLRTIFLFTVPLLLKTFAKSLIASLLWTWKHLSTVFHWSRRDQLLLLTLFVMLGVSAFLLKRTLGGGWLPAWSSGPITSLASVADHTFTYKPEEMEDFYLSAGAPEYVVSLDKVTVNLKSKIGANPMATFEFYFEGDAQETIIELKQRERAFLDALQRVIEMMSYEDLDTIEGKHRLKSLIRVEFNKILNQGHIKQVYFKSFLMKP